MTKLKSVGVAILAVFLAACTGSPEARHDRAMAKGKELFGKRDYPRAIVEFRNAAQAMPRDAEAYYHLGLAAAAAGDVRTAFLSFQKATSLDPKHTGAQVKLSQMLLHGNEQQLQDAEERLKSVAGQSASPEMLNTLAFTELQLGKVDDAVAILERSLAQAPGELMSSVLLSRTKLWQKDLKGAEQVLKTACEKAPSSADARRILGEFYLTQSRLPEAEAELKKAIEMDPKNALALQDLARLAMASGKVQEAEKTIQRLSAFEGYKSVYAIFLFEQGRREEAVREFQRLAAQNPDDRRARTNLVAAYLAMNRKPEAVKVLEGAIGKNSKDGDALLQRAEILIQEGKLNEAETDLNQVRRLRTAAPEVHYVSAKLQEARGNLLTYRQELTEALRLNPVLESVRVELARSLINRNEYRAALDVLNGAPDAQKNSPAVILQRNWAQWGLGNMAEMRKGIDEGLVRQRSADFLIQDALWKTRSGDVKGARNALDEALKTDPSDIRAMQLLTQTYGRTKESGMALQKVKEYAARQPKSAPAQHFLGTLLLANRENVAARSAFLAAKAADPRFTTADLSLAQLDIMDRKVEDAYSKINAVVAADGNNMTARQWLANLQVLKGDRAGSIESFRKVVGADPQNAEALNNLAYLLADRAEHLDEALKYAERAVELSPDKAEYYDTLGWVLYKKGVYSSAIRYFERANKGNVIVKYHLAMAYAKNGEPRKGKAVLEAALKANPNLPEAKTAREVVEAR